MAGGFSVGKEYVSTIKKFLMNDLIEAYRHILLDLQQQAPKIVDDQYSGVFLTEALAAYDTAPLKVMVVGRETAGWMGKNCPQGHLTLQSILQAHDMDSIIMSSLARYREHVKWGTRRSKFKQFYFYVAQSLRLPPDALIYANFFAWDFKRGDPRKYRKKRKAEIQMIQDYSIKLLAAQIQYYQPQIIIFATGQSIDGLIRRLSQCFTNHVLLTQKHSPELWAFSAWGAQCCRITHPRRLRKHTKKQWLDWLQNACLNDKQ